MKIFLKKSFLLSKPGYPFDKGNRVTVCILKAGVAKLVDAPDLGSGAARRGGSSPSTRTTKRLEQRWQFLNTDCCCQY